MRSLHPLLSHHVLNTLEWPALRPLQQAALQSILDGDHALLIAPTAGGKTEAAVFPMLSRMLQHDWPGLSVLYLCPLRALLNNLHPRLAHYASLVGRRVELWHGDIGESMRRAIRDEPPDMLLTTPESIEAMLLSRRTDHERLFADLQAVVVDEIHAFAGDDRGWHLLAVTERLQHIAGRELQRVGLSATIGNPEGLLGWLTRTCRGPRQVVVDPSTSKPSQPEVTVDYVGNLRNAATVISRLHRGEKRLAFVDSRARAEELAAELRNLEVVTYVSHGSLGREERRRAEQAFAESRDCVIVATSTLELGVDVGDLDRAIQIDAPTTVASFLQRLGRTGRRAGTTANTLFLATREDALIQTLGLLTAWEQGYVEPLEPPALPLHLAVQQLLAVVLQEGGVGRHTWTDRLGQPFVLGSDVEERLPELVDSLLSRDILVADNGILGIGDEGRRLFGRQYFLELTSVFSEPPTTTVLAGRTEIGQVPTRLLMIRQPGSQNILLAGRSWTVLSIDWKRRVVQVEPSPDRGSIRWFSDARALSFELCQAMKRVLAGRELSSVILSQRAIRRLERVREDFLWLERDRTTVTSDESGRKNWWTFAGSDANVWLAGAISEYKPTSAPAPSDLRISLERSVNAVQIQRCMSAASTSTIFAPLADQGLTRLKFGDALPRKWSALIARTRLRADEAVQTVAGLDVEEQALTQ